MAARGSNWTRRNICCATNWREGLTLNLKEIMELIDKVADRGIGALEIEQAGLKLRIEGRGPASQVIHSYGESSRQPMSSFAAEAGVQSEPAAASAVTQRPKDDEDGTHIITSPIVGTFFRMPNPESEAFVSVGDHVTKGKVLCIIEAMKLMNEIEADMDGEIVKIFPQNGQPIEYGEKLFAVKL